ncbi:unnamed protein product [Prorocentrum cordatum]|uniref:LRAT domain-containing protein n=1 Tax=Prorocentrum cordatum TaxID=2364126 RepID=A0ABN9W834_9DINO|nr:unnamed protein product [Polarella glacialis]
MTATSTTSVAMSRIGSIMRPMDWVSTGVSTAATGAEFVQHRLDKSGLVDSIAKTELESGDHIYAWRLGFSYNHHGIVVRTAPCEPGCQHDSLECCCVVHFVPPSETNGNFGRMEVVSLAQFSQGRSVCKCHYGVPSVNFYFQRSGSCSTDQRDPKPFSVLRALSLLDVGGDAAALEDAAAQAVEYSLLNKNNELFARWCKVGDASGVRRFRSRETAFSPQTAPGRFVRLGLAVAVPVGLPEASSFVAGGAATGAAAAAGAGSATGLSASAMAAGQAARQAAAAAGRHVLRAGSLAASEAAQSCCWTSRRPEYAAGLLLHAAPALAAAVAGSASAAGSGSGRGLPEAQREQEGRAIVASFRDCLVNLGVSMPKSLAPLAGCPYGCSRLCEMFVDVFEGADCHDLETCRVLFQSFLDELHA